MTLFVPLPEQESINQQLQQIETQEGVTLHEAAADNQGTSLIPVIVCLCSPLQIL
jgi:hypothetical protein